MTQPTPSATGHDITADRQFIPWLRQQQISIACTTYQTSRLMLLGVSPDGNNISGFERIFDRAMGLYATTDRLYLSSKYQIWRFDNALLGQQHHNGYDKLYVPRVGYTTGDLDIHDIVEVERGVDGAPWQQTLPVPFVFVSTLLNCIATVCDRYSCQPLWKPPFISRIINEDRCHLNGLAAVNGQPRYVTAISRSDIIDGWRDRRQDGGIVMDLSTNDIVATGFSMPHSPRWYRDRLWLLNSGRGELGYVDLKTGTFEPIAFCPGYLRGLAFWGDFAIVGLSQPRNGDKTFSGLPLDDILKAKDASPRCGLMVINLNSGVIEHWLRFEGIITELYDVQILPQVQRPMALGFQSEEIAQLITLGPQVPDPPQLNPTVSPAPPTPPATLTQPDIQPELADLRQHRQHLAQQWLNLPLEQLEAAYAGELGQAHRTLVNHDLRYEPLTAAEQAFIEPLMTALTTHPVPSLLALMPYRAAYQLPERWFEPITIPSWLVNDYLAYMQAVPLFFQAVGESEQYAQYLNHWFTFIHRKIHQNLNSASWQSVAAVAAEAVFAPIYFNDLNLKDTFIKWAAITEFSLEHRGMTVHQHGSPRSSHRSKIRLGVLNQAYSPHSETFSTLPFYEHLDRQQFEIILYAESSQDHPLETYCRSRCDQFVLLPQDLPESVQRIRNDDLDILLFGINIAVGNKSTARLAMHRLARVQVSANSSPVTSGINNIDYYLSGELTTPAATFQSQYSEKLATWAGPSCCYRFPASAQQPTAASYHRRNLNIAEDAVVFVSGANFFKLIPELRITWTQILAAVPNSVLLLYPFSAWSHHYPVSAFRNHMAALFADHGIDPSRLIIQDPIPNREQVKQLLQIADVYLDAYPFTGVTSLLDPLEVGLPLVTQAGHSFRSRQGPALLESMDLTDLIATDEQGYVELATQLGQDSTRRQQYRTLIQQKMAANPAFMDSPAYGAQVGTLLQQLLPSSFSELEEEHPPSASRRRQRVIAFSLWGANPKYTTGAIKNADLAPTLYPGWICRFYVDQTVPSEVVNQLKARSHVEVIQLDGDRGWKMSFARFLPAADPDVEVLICRDADSRLNQREKAAVEAWLQSPQKYHIMRDHPRHNVPILAGMWGVKGNVLDMAILVEQHLVDQADLGLRYGIDQHFLATQIYPKTQSSCMVHDEIFLQNPYPTPRQGLEYVGQVFLEDESTLKPIDELLQQHLLKNDSLALNGFEPSSPSATPATTLAAPSTVQALFERSRQLKKENQLTEAEACLREVIHLYPNHWGAYNNLGTLLQNQGNIQEAEACYQQALQLNTNFAEAHSNLASIWQLNEQPERAKAGFYRALQLKPDYVPAHLNLANLYKEQRRMAVAIEHYQKVVVAEPQHTEAHFSLGQIFEYQGKSEEALACYERALQGNPETHSLWFFISLVKIKLCNWQDYEAQVQRLQQMIAESFTAKYTPNPFVLSTFNFPLELHQAAARNQAQNAQRAVAQLRSSLAFAHPRKVTPKLRIGYLSPDLRDHAVGRLVVDLFPFHNRDQYEIVAYTTVDVEDHITQQIQTGCDAFVDLSPLSTEQTAQRIYDDGIQILVDLAGYTIGNAASVLSLQPAPIQAQWLGYPDTMGAEFIQYALADQWLISPEIAQSYTEKIVYLPHAFVGSPLTISDRPMTRAEFGVPESGFVFCCFNSHYKITPDLFDVWMRILQQVPDSVLWLIEGAETVMGNLRTEAKQRGVNPDRLVFAPKIAHEDYLARYGLADLYLDTFVYNAGSTAVATCWSGLPMLTCPGLTNASRMGASICAAAGLEPLICKSVADYEQRAVHLATHPSELAEIRNGLKQQLQSPETYPALFRVEQFVASLENAFQQMWQGYLNDAPLQDVVVSR